MDQFISKNGRWLWLGVFASLALIALSGGRLLLATGFLLLAAFTFFNNPLAPTPTQVAKPTMVVALSWVCGMLGVLAVVAAAARSWL